MSGPMLYDAQDGYVRSFWHYTTGNGNPTTYLMDKIDPNTGAILSETVLPTETFSGSPFYPMSGPMVSASVPEPSTLALLAAGAVGLLTLSRRRWRRERYADSRNDGTPVTLRFPSSGACAAELARRAA